MPEEYVMFKMRKTAVEAVIRSYKAHEERLSATGYASDRILLRFFSDLERVSKKNGYSPDTTKK